MAIKDDPRFNEVLIPFLARSMPYTNMDFDEFNQAIQDWPDFCDELRGVFGKAVNRYRRRAFTRIPTTFTVGDRTYELISVVESEDREGSNEGRVQWLANQFNARPGEDDARYIHEHQSELPDYPRVRVVMMFIGWIEPARHNWERIEKFATLHRIDGRWIIDFEGFYPNAFYGRDHWLIRRIA